MDPTDRTLVQRARQGDRQAFHQLVDRHGPGLYRSAYVMLHHAADAQDVVQETLIAAFEQLHRFEGRSTVRTWLVGILIRQAAHHRRKHRRHRMASLDVLTQDVADRPRSASSPVTQLDARLDVATLLARLSPEHRQVLVLRELEGMSYDDMAEVLGLPRGTIESRLFRARQAMKETATEE